MDLKNIPSSYHPAYAWLWNSTITKEGIRAQIEEMYEAGIRAFYIIGEPKEFRPDRRRTYLSPDYLSEAYVELVYYAFQVAEEQGMYTWLYNEGGFPSGMVTNYYQLNDEGRNEVDQFIKAQLMLKKDPARAEDVKKIKKW